MKRSDMLLLLLLVALFVPFITSFLKFAILATTGELIGLRIRTGKYYAPGFGILPRAIVWGFLGITIQAAFIIFARGVPLLLEFAGLHGSVSAMEGSLSAGKLGVAFSISLLLNIFYAPVLMTVHKVTDSHIEMNGGTLKGFFQL